MKIFLYFIHNKRTFKDNLNIKNLIFVKEIAGYSAKVITKENYIKTLWTVDKIRISEDYEAMDEYHFNTFFGKGNDITEKEKFEYMVLSQDDTKILHNKEQEVVAELLEIFNINYINNMLKVYGFDVKTIIESDVNHPVDIYNILKRTSIVWKDLQSKSKDDRIKKILGMAFLVF